MTCTLSNSPALTDLLDIVDTAVATISRRLPAHIGRDDLASIGKLALITAHAQIEGGIDEVRAYCFVRVRGAMLDELRRLDSLPRNRRTQATAIAQAERLLAQRLGRAPSLDELATETQLSARAITSIQRELAATRSVAAEIEWASLPDTDAPSPLQNVERDDLHRNLRTALERLSANQALALRLYYLEDATLDDIAARLRVSRERARQVREAGEKKLRVDLAVLHLWQSLINHY
ncbi:sigma-70 family RNA polymerase sigma factor [Oleiharenicola lentus]|uniref:sigma-70 family RNA polymerase sigma factor n=1 Tax=Oleiharenicola lentus TaxID=2508720 RepID=UPI003F672BA4